jgi:hypothetical protein
MPAPTGNTNATRWTLETTLEKLQLIEEYAEDYEHCLQLGRALRHARIYSGIWSYWKKKWADNDEIMDRIGIIEQIFIDRISEGAMTKRLHGGVCIFILKVNYGLTDRAPKEETIKEEKEKGPSPEEIAAHKEREIERVHQKVLAYNEAHPEAKLFAHSPYTDIRPNHNHYIEFPGEFFLEI